MRRGELADLIAFIAVADNLSFRAAAVRLGITPSALSHAVRQLEEGWACACCTARPAASP
jgi:DNA-binding transcriptional LysR family regulator